MCSSQEIEFLAKRFASKFSLVVLLHLKQKAISSSIRVCIIQDFRVLIDVLAFLVSKLWRKKLRPPVSLEGLISFSAQSAGEIWLCKNLLNLSDCWNLKG